MPAIDADEVQRPLRRLPCRRFPIGETPMVLSEMGEGKKCIVDRVGGTGALRRRLLEMGIVRGTEVYVEKYAPLRDPLELIVKGYHVSLRVEEAAQIRVTDVQIGSHG